MNLEGKKILFIGPVFNSYEQKIVNALKKKGAEVTFVPEKLYNKFYYYLNKLNPLLNQKNQRSFLLKEMDTFKDYYDYLFVIRGEYLDEQFFKKLFSKSKFGKKIMYQWDSVKNNPNILDIVKFFNHVYTFDHDDSKVYNFLYKPLFFTDDFQSNGDENEYDFGFIGSFYYDRAKFIVDIKKFATENNLKVNINLYMTYFRFLQMKLKKEYQMITREDVIFKPMSLNEVSRIIKKSKIVLDVANQYQNGLTIRTFEALGTGKKLLTNNKNIISDDFYNEDCICFYDNLSISFLEKTCQISSFEKYHIDNWLMEFFDD